MKKYKYEITTFVELDLPDDWEESEADLLAKDI